MSRYAPLTLVLLFACGSKPPEKQTSPAKVPVVNPVATAPSKTPATVPTPAAAVVVPSFKKEKMTLYDPRVPTSMPSVSKEESEKVLGKLFTKRLQKIEECDKPEPGAKETKEDIASGQIAPSVVTKLTGAFTAPGLSQSLYIVNVGECNAVETRDAPATSYLWVLAMNDEIKAQLQGERADFFVPFDVDQNGTLEMLTVVDGSSGGGSRYQYADLFTISEKEVKKIESFTSHDVQSNYCSVPSEDGTPSSQEIRVVSLTPTEAGKLPTFSDEKLLGTCGEKPEWKPAP